MRYIRQLIKKKGGRKNEKSKPRGERGRRRRRRRTTREATPKEEKGVRGGDGSTIFLGRSFCTLCWPYRSSSSGTDCATDLWRIGMAATARGTARAAARPRRCSILRPNATHKRKMSCVRFSLCQKTVAFSSARKPAGLSNVSAPFPSHGWQVRRTNHQNTVSAATASRARLGIRLFAQVTPWHSGPTRPPACPDASCLSCSSGASPPLLFFSSSLLLFFSPFLFCFSRCL